MTTVQQAPPSAISYNSSESQGLGLGHRKGMVIASFNVNSLLLHIDEIRTLVKDLGIQILAINETKLDENIHDDLVSIEGYAIRRCDRNHHGGGVAIYIRDSTCDKCKLRNDIPVSSLETICVEIKPVPAAPFFILAWCRPPDAPPDTFNEIESKEIIFLGDINCDILPNLRTGDCAGA